MRITKYINRTHFDKKKKNRNPTQRTHISSLSPFVPLLRPRRRGWACSPERARVRNSTRATPSILPFPRRARYRGVCLMPVMVRRQPGRASGDASPGDLSATMRYPRSLHRQRSTGEPTSRMRWRPWECGSPATSSGASSTSPPATSSTTSSRPACRAGEDPCSPLIGPWFGAMWICQKLACVYLDVASDVC
jgi:hypothetical protein